MIGVYDYTVLLTYIGFASGVIGIVEAFREKPLIAILCLMISGLCDMFDGRVARTKKKRTDEERNFGIQLDSLSDLVCFGVLPAMIGYSIGLSKSFLIPLIIFYPLAALIRLAYFNVLEITRNSNTPVKEYTGLPVTSSALIFPFIFIFKKLLASYFVPVYGAVLFIVGVLFITKFKIKKPDLKTMLWFVVIGVIEIILIIVFRRFV